MKTQSLRARLLILTLLPSALITTLLVAYFSYSGIQSLENEMRARGLASVRYLAPISEYNIIAGQMDQIYGLAQAAMQQPGSKAVIIVNTKGRTLAVSGRVSLSAETIRQTLSRPAMVAETENWIAFGAPILRSQSLPDPLFELEGFAAGTPETVGHIFIEFDRNELHQRKRQLVRQGILAIALSLLIMGGAVVLMADRLARPLQRLSDAVKRVAGGQFDTRVPVRSTGELRTLEDGFNVMAQRIEDSHRTLQTRIEEATAQLVHQARHDALTSLPNRREFELRLKKSLDNVHAGSDEFSVLFIDLDRFKAVNDACGHPAGDELLRQIAMLFKGRLRDEDTLARLGGDEFGALLVNCGQEKAHQVAKDICALAAEYRFVWEGQIFSIGASIGLIPVNRSLRDVQEIIALSDAACLQAKDQGRNQVCLAHTSVTNERRRDQGSWASRLASALNEGRLIVEAIPLRAMNSRVSQLPGTEISARLNEPGQGPISLTALLEAAQRYELASTFDHHFLEVGIKALARAQRQGRKMFCLIPLSKSAITTPETANFLSRQLLRLNVSGEGLYLMFTEDIGSHHASQLAEFAHRIAPLGCRIALSDFGNGAASFSHLNALRPSHLRLSQSLTRDIENGRTSTALLRAILEIAREQNIVTIADGVDDTLLLECLRNLGVDYVQGKAVAPHEPFDAWFEGVVMRGCGE